MEPPAIIILSNLMLRRDILVLPYSASSGMRRIRLSTGLSGLFSRGNLLPVKPGQLKEQWRCNTCRENYEIIRQRLFVLPKFMLSNIVVRRKYYERPGLRKKALRKLDREALKEKHRILKQGFVYSPKGCTT